MSESEVSYSAFAAVVDQGEKYATGRAFCACTPLALANVVPALESTRHSHYQRNYNPLRLHVIDDNSMLSARLPSSGKVSFASHTETSSHCSLTLYWLAHNFAAVPHRRR